MQIMQGKHEWFSFQPLLSVFILTLSLKEVQLMLWYLCYKSQC